MTQNFNRLLLITAIFSLHIATASAAPAHVTATIEAFDEKSIIRTDIGRATFGSGVEHQNPQFRQLMAAPSATQTVIKNMNMGSFRFSNGTPGLFYYWNMPKESYISVPGPVKADLLTPDEIYTFTGTAGLNMERLFEVNTSQYLSPDFVLHPVIDPKIPKATINTNNLGLAADSAAAWVADNKNKAPVKYWEVGNEDWVYWTPAEYATIFNAFSTKMKKANPDIKILAQSLTGNIKLTGKPDNDYTWLQGMINGGINTSNVYALSEHEYMAGGNFTTGSYNDQRIWQTQNMFAQVDQAWNVPYLKSVLSANRLSWKIWMTEFNVDPKGPNGQTAILQDLGHALVIADWTGKMLEQGVERIFMLSLDHNPYYALVNYVNSGGTIAAPRVTAPGYAFTKYAQEFGNKMVKTTTLGNATLSSPNKGNYQQVAVYSSVMESDPVYAGYPSMRVMVINRSTTDAAEIVLKTLNRPIAGPEKNYFVQTLTSSAISDSNNQAADVVKWSSKVAAPSNSAAITKTLPKNSASFFIIPLQ
jgi:hypothetical protein